MALVFRTNGAWGAGKGSKLTPEEVDGNFWDHEQRIAAIETALGSPTAPITDIDTDGGVMTITVAGGATFNVPLPVAAFSAEGTWAHPSHYEYLDIVTVDTEGGYLVLQEHDTETPFDPNRLQGGLPVYQLMFPPGAAGPAGADGAAGPAGPAGTFAIDAAGAFATRGAFDDEDAGFTFLSTDGEDGLGGLQVVYIMGEGGSGDWTGAFAFQGPQGPAGATGPAGPNGLNFNVDETGLFADRDDFDAEAEGFSYLSTDGDGTGVPPGSLASIYFRETATPGVWSTRVPFQGPTGATGAAGATGATGPAGPTGPAGANFDVDATGVFADRASYNAQPQGFSFLSTNGDGTGVAPGSEASIYIKNSNTSGDWSARIPFQGPKGNTGAQGPIGPAGPPGTNGANGTNGVGVPSGGTTGQVLAKTSNANFATAWVDPTVGSVADFTDLGDVPSSYTGHGGKHVRVNSGATGLEFVADYARRLLKTVSTSTYTAIAGDELRYLRFTNAAGCTVTVNQDVFAADDELFMRATQGQVILAGTATAAKPADTNAKSRGAQSTIHLYFVDPDNYDLTGDLEVP